jgi:hypothetical protein
MFDEMEQQYSLGVHRGLSLRRLLGYIYLRWRLERLRRRRDLRLLPPASDVFVGFVAATAGATEAFAAGAFAAGAFAAGVVSSSSLPRSQSSRPISTNSLAKKRGLVGFFLWFYV